MIGSVPDVLAGGLQRGGPEDSRNPRLLKRAAAEFESLLVSELLKSMRETGSEGWLGAGDDQAGSTMIEMAEQQVAQAIASSGGIGLSKLILEGITPNANGVAEETAVLAGTADKEVVRRLDE
jgi:Rod binding domain-containing protein